MQFLVTALVGLLLFQGTVFNQPPEQISTVSSVNIAEENTVPLPLSANTFVVKVTAYNAVPSQTDNTPHITASGAYANPNIVVARSRDLAKQLPFGTIIEIEPPVFQKACGYNSVKSQIGYRVIADTMNVHKQNQIDILLNYKNKVSIGNTYKNPSIVFGICRHVNIRIVGYISINKIPRTQSQLVHYIKMHTRNYIPSSQLINEIAFR